MMSDKLEFVAIEGIDGLSQEALDFYSL